MCPGETDHAFARVVLRERGDWLLDELAGLKRRPGEESIHDTRVQSRRMRAALEAFQDLFPSPQRESLYDSVRGITRALGEARETEVMLSLLSGLTNGRDVGENLCREYLEEKLQRKLLKFKGKLFGKLRGMDSRLLRSQIKQLLASVANQAMEQPASQRTESHEEKIGHALRILREVAKPILDFRARYQFSRASDKRLHGLRIAAKKLRYAMEIFDPSWSGGLKKEITLARVLQDAGGHHQDWAVLKQFLQAEIRRLMRQNRSYLAFQAGRLLATAEDKKAELRKEILPALTELQTSLRPILEPHSQAPEAAAQAIEKS